MPSSSSPIFQDPLPRPAETSGSIIKWSSLCCMRVGAARDGTFSAGPPHLLSHPLSPCTEHGHTSSTPSTAPGPGTPSLLLSALLAEVGVNIPWLNQGPRMPSEYAFQGRPAQCQGLWVNWYLTKKWAKILNAAWYFLSPMYKTLSEHLTNLGDILGPLRAMSLAFLRHLGSFHGGTWWAGEVAAALERPCSGFRLGERSAGVGTLPRGLQEAGPFLLCTQSTMCLQHQAAEGPSPLWVVPP